VNPPVLPRGHVFFQTDLEGPKPLEGWSGAGQTGAGCRSPQALCIERAADARDRAVVAVIRLPVEAMRGYTIHGRAMVRGEGVAEKPQPWNGVKFMAAVESPSGKAWPQAEIPAGTFDWQPAAFAARIPADASQVLLYLGLEAVTGKAWFDDVRITVAKPPFVLKPPAAAGPVYKGHNLPRLRGAMISPRIDEAGLQTLGREWNANLLRWQLIRHAKPGQQTPPDAFDTWLEEELKRLDAALPLCEKHGLYVVVDLHSPPGGRATVSGYIGSDAGLFTDKASQDKFVESWRKMAARYRGAKAVWAFDLANEPVEGMVGDGCDDWQALATRAAKAVCEADPERTLIVEPPDWGGPRGFEDFVPIDVPRVVYSVHMYLPHAFTHQTVHGGKAEYRYPGDIEGKAWDKAQLEAALAPVIAFQKRYNVHIYVGEFSAIRWAPDQSACRYLADVVDIFERHGWDWSYHAFREWHGWSVEHGPDRNVTTPADQPTDRQRLLCEWFGKNQKPAWQVGRR
jgi:hypothetical protein